LEFLPKGVWEEMNEDGLSKEQVMRLLSDTEMVDEYGESY
jgi:hypothetical protein